MQGAGGCRVHHPGGARVHPGTDAGQQMHQAHPAALEGGHLGREAVHVLHQDLMLAAVEVYRGALAGEIEAALGIDQSEGFALPVEKALQRGPDRPAEVGL